MAGLLACYCRTMIPYDDLVVALATWRARQGLPVAQPVGAPTPPAKAAPPPATRTSSTHPAARTSSTHAAARPSSSHPVAVARTSSSQPAVQPPAPQPAAPQPAARTAPPSAPPRAAPPPPQAPSELNDFDEGENALVEGAQYDADGDDFEMAFNNVTAEPGGEATAIGGALEPSKSGKRNPSW